MENGGIPKIIHYCWFGGAELPENVVKCINSWKKYCPDYEIIQWNERNYDIKKNPYMWEAYQHKKWGFVSDYARLDIVYHYGGIYLDTDVEIIRPIDVFLEYAAFAGMEQPGIVAMGLGFGACKGNPLIKEIMEVYDTISFIREDGTLNLTPSPQFQTRVLKKYGLRNENINQTIKGMEIFSTEYFCPIEFSTNIMRKTKNTYLIHHFTASWYTPKQERLRKLKLNLNKKHIPKAVQDILIMPYRISITIDNVGVGGFVGLLYRKIRRKV